MGDLKRTISGINLRERPKICAKSRKLLSFETTTNKVT